MTVLPRKVISLKQWFIYLFSLLKKRQIQFSYLAELYLGKGSKAAKVVVNEDDTFFAACRLAGPILG